MVLYVSYLAFRSETLGKVATFTLLAGFSSNGGTPAPMVRILQMGIGGATNLRIWFFARTIAIVYLLMERKFKIKRRGPDPFRSSSWLSSLNNPPVPACKQLADLHGLLCGICGLRRSASVFISVQGEGRTGRQSPGGLLNYLPTSICL